jgi:hypothetical protein
MNMADCYANFELRSNSDPNCGAAYTAAIDDTLYGALGGCSGANPTSLALPPTRSSICVQARQFLNSVEGTLSNLYQAIPLWNAVDGWHMYRINGCCRGER